MLLNDFYEITEVIEGEDAHFFGIRLNPLHHIYEGHFSGQPVVPGVCTLQIIKDCAEKLSGKTYRYAYLSSSKFLSLVDPRVNDLLVFALSQKESDDGRVLLTAEGKYQQTGTVFIKLKATLKVIEHE